MALHWFNAEGQPDGTVLTTSNASTGSNDAVQVSNTALHATYSIDHAAHGTKAIKSVCVTGETGFVFQNGYSDAAGANQCQGYFTGYPPSTAEEILQIRTPTGNVAKLLVLSSGLVQIAQGNGTQVGVSTGFTVPLNTWLRFDLRAAIGTSATTGTILGGFSPLDSTTATWSGGSTACDAGTVNLADYRAGKLTAASVPGLFYFDDFKWDNGATSFIPAAAAPPLSATLTLSPTGSTPAWNVTASAAATGGTGTAKTFNFDWGDGTAATGATSSATATHTYTTSGVKTVTVTVLNT
jgi:hypothetical protein